MVIHFRLCIFRYFNLIIQFTFRIREYRPGIQGYLCIGFAYIAYHARAEYSLVRLNGKYIIILLCDDFLRLPFDWSDASCIGLVIGQNLAALALLLVRC